MNDPGRNRLPVKEIELRRFTARSSTMSIAPESSMMHESDESFTSHTGPLRNETVTGQSSYSSQEMSIQEVELCRELGRGRRMANLLKSGPLSLCINPDCNTCTAAPNGVNRSDYKPLRHVYDSNKLRRVGDAREWGRKLLNSYFPITNPHAKAVQRWNKFFVVSCFVAVFIDPLFFFLLSIQKHNKCIVLNWSLATEIATLRSVSDFIYLLHMLLQFRLAYVAPESRVVGAGDLVDQPKKIALHYLREYFILDLFVVLPLPQVMLLVVIPNYLGSSAANYAKNLLRATVLLQYIPRIIRFVPLLGGRSASGFIFESPWANFVINLLMFVLAGHVVGSCWYLFGLQRVNRCLQDACFMSKIADCKTFIDCGRGNNINKFNAIQAWHDWLNDSTSTDCLDSHGNFRYGVYQPAVLLTTKRSIITRYIYSLAWGFQQISTLAGSQVPSYFEGEVLFTMAIIGLGLLLFALLIGNMQNFLQALGRRRFEMQLKQRDVEQWMSHRSLPEDIRRFKTITSLNAIRKVRQAERFSWTATRGVNEEELLQNLPEDLQREIRRHFFKFLKKVRIFRLTDEPILDAVCEKLRQKFYLRGSDIFYQGGSVEKMVFIVRGQVVSIGSDGNRVPLSEGDVCGEELLTWYLEQSTVQKDEGKIRSLGQHLFSTRTVNCLTNVEAFALTGVDLEEVIALFARFLRNQRVQGAIRYQSPYWRNMAATQIQVAWRYRQWRLKHRNGPNHDSAYSSLLNCRTVNPV